MEQTYFALVLIAGTHWEKYCGVYEILNYNWMHYIRNLNQCL